MGSSTSKAAKQAAGAAARKYPSRPTPPSQTATNAPPRQPPPAQNRQPGPTVRPQAHATGSKDEAINLDASDPDFARSLRSLGAVQPNPTMSPTSAFPHPRNPNNPTHPGSMPTAPAAPDPRTNPALMVLDARNKIQEEADKEFIEAGKRGHAGRQFLDATQIRQILVMRDERGVKGSEIERQLGLRAGVVDRLGSKGVVGASQTMS